MVLLIVVALPHCWGASLVAQSVKNLPRVQETWVQSLGWEDPPEKEMATHSSILVWEIPRTEEPGGLQSMGLQTVVPDLVTKQQPMKPKTFCIFLPFDPLYPYLPPLNPYH